MRIDISPGISTLRAVCAEPYGVWLDSSMAGETLGTRSFWAAEPVAVLRSWGRRVEVERRSATERFEGDPFEALAVEGVASLASASLDPNQSGDFELFEVPAGCGPRALEARSNLP